MSGSACRVPLPEAFSLYVLAELRRRFGFSDEALNHTATMMSSEGVLDFTSIVEIIHFQSVSVLLVTDGESRIRIDTSMELGREMQDSALPWGLDGFVVLNLNPIVRRLLLEAKAEVELPEGLEGHARYKLLRELTNVRSLAEFQVLAAVRNPKFHEVTVKLQAGDVELLQAEERLPLVKDALLTDGEQLTAAIGDLRFGRVEIVVHDGKPRHLLRRTSVKPR